MAGLDPRFPEERSLKQSVASNRVAQQPIAPPTPNPVSTPRPVSTPTGRYSRPTAPPAAGPGPIPSIDAFLTGDTGYQQQLRQFGQALSDFMADATRRRGSLDSEYGLSQKAMGDQRIKDLKSFEEDYGARGLLRSGLYGSAVSDYEQEFGQRSSDLSRRQQEALAMLSQEQGQYGSQQELQKQAAREAAIRRRAEQFGV